MPRLWRRVARLSIQQLIAITSIVLLVGCLAPPPVAAVALQRGEQIMNARGRNIWNQLESVIASVRAAKSQEPKALRPSPPPTKAEREERVAVLDVNPANEITLHSRQPLIFTAIPLDQEGKTIHGLRPTWESSNK